jgi:flagellar L-ring protein precursor FlgH
MTQRTTLMLLTAAAAGLGFASAAPAQQQPSSRAPQAAAGRPPAAGQQAVRVAPDPTRNQTALAFARSGGSLARASLAAAPAGQDPAGQPTDPSFYSVPEAEPKVIRKHDLITVIVREESSFSSAGTTDTKRQSDIEARLEEFIKLKIANYAIEGGAQGLTPPAIKATANRNFKGEGTVDRTDSMTARMTAEVVDVKPNGTLVLQARKTIKTDDEVQAFVLTGTARVEDVVADNTVLSTQMYDLVLEKSTKGAVRSATQRGLVHKVLDFINPF